MKNEMICLNGAEHAICKSSYRNFECVCQSGYKGDGKTACVATGTTVETSDKPASQGCNSVDIGLTCSPSQMAFTVPDCFFTDRNIDPMTVHIGQTKDMDECSGMSDPAMTGDWLFSIDTNKCDIETSSNDTHIWYKGQLKTGLAKSANSVITRVAKRFELDLRCELAKSVGITMHEYFVPLVSSETVKVDTVASSASFQVDMSLFNQRVMLPHQRVMLMMRSTTCSRPIAAADQAVSCVIYSWGSPAGVCARHSW